MSGEMTTGVRDKREIVNWTCKVCGALWDEQAAQCRDHLLKVTPRVPVTFVPKVLLEQSRERERAALAELRKFLKVADTVLSFSGKEINATFYAARDEARAALAGQTEQEQ